VGSRTVRRVLVVEDNPALLRTLVASLQARFAEVRGAGSVAEARARLESWQPELALLDVALPDGTALEVMDLFRGGPAPAVVAISAEAEPAQAFELARRGVRIYLPKPATMDEVTRALGEALATGPDLVPHLRQSVGHRPLHQVETEVRTALVDEALSRVSGSRRAAARLLAISRSLLQHILRRRK